MGTDHGMNEDTHHELATIQGAHRTEHDWTTDPDASPLREVRQMLIEMRDVEDQRMPLHHRIIHVVAQFLKRPTNAVEEPAR